MSMSMLISVLVEFNVFVSVLSPVDENAEVICNFPLFEGVLYPHIKWGALFVCPRGR